MAKKISKENTEDTIKEGAKDNTYVRARIDSTTKTRAAAALESMGLSVSDAIRLLMLRIADEGAACPLIFASPAKQLRRLLLRRLLR
jgi:antitoxin component of RelBE/YafQ-DinJ toxin-antitoxin module